MKPHFVLLGLLPLALFAQSDALYQFDVAIDPLEVRMLPLTDDPEPDSQRALRAESGWNDWADNHPRWQAIMSEATGLPHRAFGPAVEVPGATVADKAAAFAANELASFGVEAVGDFVLRSGTRAVCVLQVDERGAVVHR